MEVKNGRRLFLCLRVWLCVKTKVLFFFLFSFSFFLARLFLNQFCLSVGAVGKTCNCYLESRALSGQRGCGCGCKGRRGATGEGGLVQGHRIGTEPQDWYRATGIRQSVARSIKNSPAFEPAYRYREVSQAIPHPHISWIWH